MSDLINDWKRAGWLERTVMVFAFIVLGGLLAFMTLGILGGMIDAL